MDPMDDEREDSHGYTEKVNDLLKDIRGGSVHMPVGGFKKVPSIESLSVVGGKVQSVWKVVLTGGPCGGKTTSLSVLADKLMSHGFKVYTVPENATMFSTAGAGFPVNSNQEHQLTWETSRMIVQMQMEDSYEAIARASSQPTVILCDRGVVDARAYMDDSTWERVMIEMGWDDSAFIDDRYDLVLHMVTTAIGAPRYYVNTVYRHETPEQAAALDRKIQAAWKGHKKNIQIDNSTGYDEKIQRVWDTLCSVVDITVPSNSVTFELSTEVVREDFSKHLPHLERVQTTLVFLQNTKPELQSFLRTRKQNNSFSFTLGRKLPERYTERHISQKEFLALLKLAHTQYNPIEFDKLLWMEQNQTGSYFYELSHHVSLHTSFCTLKIETSGTISTSLESLPEWLRPHITKDITNDPDWELFEMVKRISHKKCPRCKQPGERSEDGSNAVKCSCGCVWCFFCVTDCSGEAALHFDGEDSPCQEKHTLPE
eukprot:TRINITY_DN13507_c0_g1_i1.p1 TRINITY_DN13507_c0_g1~~TRINITY_DN13507_c0_g1_i1.p1  ORF type:complete len:513 (+),score=86.04 TRINITY_DN13507_c0_g1_i1:90-1541(+)